GTQVWAAGVGAPVLIAINRDGGSLPQVIGRFQGDAILQATDGVNGFHLWRTDGTPAGTSLAASPVFPIGQVGTLASAFYFGAKDSSAQYQLWRSDGTAAGSAPIFPLQAPLTWFQPFGNDLFFSAGPNAALMRTDGTGAGTFAVSGVQGG